MKLRNLMFVAILPFTLTLGGCIISVDGENWGHHDWEDREYKNRKLIADLKLESSTQQIQTLLGVPDFSEFHRENTDDVQILFYRTHRNHGDGVTTKDECTPLVFRNNRLVGWGDAAYRTI